MMTKPSAKPCTKHRVQPWMKTWIHCCLQHAGLVLFIGTLLSCGTNVVQKYAPTNDQEKAELDMESHAYAQAAEKLERVLASDPTNHKARSLLAASYAAQAGITTLELVKNASSTQTSTGSGLQKITALLPTVTQESLTLMGQACDAMATIPAPDRTEEMKLQYSLFFSSYAFLQIKYFLENQAALTNMTPEDASKILLTLVKLSEVGGSSPLSKAATSFATSVEQTSGSQLERVKTVLTANSSGSGG